jgi:hypothetical protein
VSDRGSILDTLRSATPPRDELICRKLAAGIEPIWGFVVYGILWIWVGSSLAFGAAVGFVMLMTRALGDGSWLAWGAFVVFFIGFAVVVWSFARWVRSRRGGARALFRDGRFFDGEVESVHHIWIRRSEITRIKLAVTVDGKRGHAIASTAGHISVSGAVPALVLSGYRYCATFIGGALCTATWHG